jgi:DNA polymerase-3 subunit alpha
MNNSDFTHLHLHSEYSALDGLGSPDQYAEVAKDMGFTALAITDHGNIDGHLRWQKSCERAGIRPVLGCELYMVSDANSKNKEDPRGHMTVLAKSEDGWSALAKMLTVANLDGFYYKPRLDFKAFLANVNRGLVVMTGCSNSFLKMPGGVDLLVELAKNRKIDCYLEVMPHAIDDQIKKPTKFCSRFREGASGQIRAAGGLRSVVFFSALPIR